MKLRCFGTAGYHPSNSRHTSCYFVEEAGLVLDAGTGLFRIADFLGSRKELDIVLSHAHLDHIFGLSFLLGLQATTALEAVRVYGEREKLEAIQKHLLSDFLFPVQIPCEWFALESLDAAVRIGNAKLQWMATEHPGGSVGYRFDWPERSLAYITDTVADRGSPYVDMIQGVDLLLHECNFPTEQAAFAKTTGHSHTHAVLEVCEQCAARQTLLTHFSPYTDAPDPVHLELDLEKFPSLANRVSIASDNQCVEF